MTTALSPRFVYCYRLHSLVMCLLLSLTLFIDVSVALNHYFHTSADTCMSRWISLVISGGTSPPTEYARQQKLLKSLLLTAGKTSVSSLDPSTVSLIFGENPNATSLFFRCTGEKEN